MSSRQGAQLGFQFGGVESLAQALSRLATIYVLSDDPKQVRSLSPGDLEGGKFRDGGREVVFSDGRTKISRLAVRLKELHPAIEALKRGSSPSREQVIRN